MDSLQFFCDLTRGVDLIGDGRGFKPEVYRPGHAVLRDGKETGCSGNPFFRFSDV